MKRLWGVLVIGAMGVAGGIIPAAASASNATFSNTTAIVGPSGPDVGKASPSPSSITVSGMTGVVTDVNVFFHGFFAGNPDDVDALLQAPFGQTPMLMGAVAAPPMSPTSTASRSTTRREHRPPTPGRCWIRA